MIRKANIGDIKDIHLLLSHYGSKGMLLPRPLTRLYDHTRDFWVSVEEDMVVGCCALQFCWEDLAEVRSLAVKKEYWGKNIGTMLVDFALQEAKKYNIKKIFSLTYCPDFFTRLGFRVISRSDLPLKIWADCILCVKYPNCDETAVMINIDQF